MWKNKKSYFVLCIFNMYMCTLLQYVMNFSLYAVALLRGPFSIFDDDTQSTLKVLFIDMQETHEQAYTATRSK